MEEEESPWQTALALLCPRTPPLPDPGPDPKQESHWQTVLALLCEQPVAVRPADRIQLQYSADFGARVDLPTKYGLRGGLLVGR